MKELFTKSLFKYVMSTFILVAITGAILSLIVTDYVLLIAVLVIEYFVLILVLLHLFDKYIKPIEKAVDTVTELAEGNYNARVHHPSNGSIGILSNKINRLARNLSELTINEKLQAEQLSTIIDNTESGLVLIDEKGYIHVVNRKFISMFGKDQRDYIGHLYYDVLENEKIHETVQKTFLYEENIKEYFTQSKPTGRNYIEIVGAPIFDEMNILKGAVLVLYDITEFKNLELMRKDFVANVSHELKTPITSIRGFAETLVDGEVKDEESVKEFTGIIHEESKRLQLLIDDLLILSRLERDEFELNVSDIAVTSLVKDIIPMTKHRAEENQITFNTDIDEELIIQGDQEKLKQVLLNLLTNAVNYTPAKGEITFRINKKDNQACIQVIDSGIGIDDEFIARIFERFYRVDRARSRNTGGTGLGLAIVKHIVELHEGNLEVKSELNKGTTFTVLLPME